MSSPPRSVKCPECEKIYPGRKITFDMGTLDPYYYDLYSRKPEIFWKSVFTCRGCEMKDNILTKKEW